MRHFTLFQGLVFTAPTRPPLNWRQGRLLGQGGFGKVYLINDKDTGRELAMKQVGFAEDNQEITKVTNTMQSYYVSHVSH